MKMTKEQVAELLLKMNDDCSNVEDYDGNGKFYEARGHTLDTLLYHISKGAFFRIKDNAVKEVTPALLGAKCKFRTADYYAIIIAVDTTNERIYLPHDNEMGSTQFNNDWQLVED